MNNNADSTAVPPPLQIGDTNPRKTKNKRIRKHSLICIPSLVLISALAIGFQAWGLRSLVQYAAQRETWDVEKQQQTGIRTEWNKLLTEYQNKATDEQQRVDLLSAQLSKLNLERDSLAKDVSKLRGEQQGLELARTAALDAQRRAQQQEQTALDAEQTAILARAELEKELKTLNLDTERLTDERNSLQQTVDTNSKTLESQKKQLVQQSKSLSEYDKRLIDIRDELRTQSNAIIQASAELSELLKNKQEAASKLSIIEDKTEELTSINKRYTELEAKVSVLSEEKVKLEEEVGKQIERLARAKTMLGDYTVKWSTRKKLIEDIDEYNSSLIKLEAEKKGLLAENNRLEEHKADLDANVTASKKTLDELESRIEKLLATEEKHAKRILDTSIPKSNNTTDDNTTSD